jgi:hypothetical protein
VLPRSRIHTMKITATETDGTHRLERSRVRLVENAIASQIASHAIQHTAMTVIAPCRTALERTDRASLSVQW